MVDASSALLRRETKPVPTFEPVYMRNDPQLTVPIELCKLWTTLPKPLRSHSNFTPSPIYPASSLREERIIWFQLAKLPPSTTVLKMISTGALMT